MSDDLVKRLREMCGGNGILAIRDIYDHDVLEAADRIEQLEAALRGISKSQTLYGAMMKADYALGKFAHITSEREKDEQ